MPCKYTRGKQGDAGLARSIPPQKARYIRRTKRRSIHGAGNGVPSRRPRLVRRRRRRSRSGRGWAGLQLRAGDEAGSGELGEAESRVQRLQRRRFGQEAVPHRHRHQERRLPPRSRHPQPHLRRHRLHPHQQRQRNLDGVKRQGRHGVDRRQGLQPQEAPVAHALRAHHQRKAPPGRAPARPRERRRQRRDRHHRHPLQGRRARFLLLPAQKGAGGAGGRQMQIRRGGRALSDGDGTPALAAEADGELLPVHGFPHGAAVHRERVLERPGQGEADDPRAAQHAHRAAAGRREAERAPGAAAQRQAGHLLQPTQQHHLLRDVTCLIHHSFIHFHSFMC